jgi:hypothetical protein
VSAATGPTRFSFTDTASPAATAAMMLPLRYARMSVVGRSAVCIHRATAAVTKNTPGKSLSAVPALLPTSIGVAMTSAAASIDEKPTPRTEPMHQAVNNVSTSQMRLMPGESTSLPISTIPSA